MFLDAICYYSLMKIDLKISIEKEYYDILQENQYENNLSTPSRAIEYNIHNNNVNFKDKPFDTFQIHNRRYMGSKKKLLNFIEKSIQEQIGEYKSFLDIFSGTGVVGHHFNNDSSNIFTNDLLYSNYISNNAFLSEEEFDYNKIDNLICEFNSLKGKENYFSKNYGNKFFSMEVSKKIGSIREKIEKLYKNEKLNLKEKSILITSLMYASDKIANTCGHYDAYREKCDFKEGFILKHLDIFHNKNIGNKCFNSDANNLFENIENQLDIVYADPPYNSRQYSSSYHLLENLARWNKPETEGKTSKMINRKKLNSNYCYKNAINSFEKLVNTVNAKYFILSYSNMGIKGNERSNAKMEDKDIIRILEKKGDLIIKSENHSVFSTGKSNINNHKERLFICKLR